ncbi:MAG: zinc ribbon domain-containing protein [Melioribacteraceae bacterium]|nr:MAG: zinc ribbon domain-containing protein [Melioribacteraceae bacterium]
MPNYDYQCISCGFTFEEFQKMTDEPLKICPECNGTLKRLIGTGLGPIFKGTGFYQTDYKNSSMKKESNKTESSSKSENKTESKEVTKAKKPE